MGEHHSSAAVALKAELVKSLPKEEKFSLRVLLGINFVLLKEVKVLVPLVADDLKVLLRSRLTLPQVKHLTGMIMLRNY